MIINRDEELDENLIQRIREIITLEDVERINKNIADAINGAG